MRAQSSANCTTVASSCTPAAPRQQPPRARASRLTTAAASIGARGGAATAAAPPGGRQRERTLTLGTGELTATSSAVGTSINYRIRRDGTGGGGVKDFLDKLWLVWQIFFPERQPDTTPKDGAKQRLRMILVADRCGLSPSGLSEMKKNILRALEEFVDIETEEEIDVSISIQPDLGTIYCVAVPVKRVKPEARMGLDGGADGMDVFEWDPEDKESDPSSRFPMGC
ncbi:chloroplast division site-determinant MinE [Monoraphidium neglectum]|uniref:Chloroplast division site-determinant MinE n=1 Tax=Monoraphidium neglectum TaxID=145388 RepID=A0A0D2MV53_9CHLO|nr:chloroplast division site-determinant MinE [Monoraphidium neglectum]KIY98225.1 chloroplast division site-determinant MinE [Monoraphidium neglectum]|eukprot:XP_013897245.1 chloroplast division site-determinant MinE [Monoraphidium neglectum]